MLIAHVAGPWFACSMFLCGFTRLEALCELLRALTKVCITWLQRSNSCHCRMHVSHRGILAGDTRSRTIFEPCRRPLAGVIAAPGRVPPVVPSNQYCAIHRLLSANIFFNCAVVVISSRKCIFTWPNWHLITWNGCSTVACTNALRFSTGAIIQPMRGVRFH